ncbi:MAG: rhodanese-like domain-containing protein [Anaerolineae bacterium]|nr:rhodanese-like domain-containing protein [Anaerolineae bacterium]
MIATRVAATPPLTEKPARDFFADKLRYETDPADVCADLQDGLRSFVLLDVRSAADYAGKHAQGAESLPYRDINRKRMAAYPEDALFVVYCWGPGCNGSTKAALRLAELGYAVKEMIGGIEYWEREGYPLVIGRA